MILLPPQLVLAQDVPEQAWDWVLGQPLGVAVLILGIFAFVLALFRKWIHTGAYVQAQEKFHEREIARIEAQLKRAEDDCAKAEKDVQFYQKELEKIAISLDILTRNAHVGGGSQTSGRQQRRQ